MGFIRNTLRKWLPEQHRFACDLVMGVPAGFELAATTGPYYRSTYALVYVKGKGLDAVHDLHDLLTLPPEQRQSLRIGLFAPSPAADWMASHGMIAQEVSYPIQSGDPGAYPGQIIEHDLMQGKLDAAFVWGPIAGYFGKQMPDAGLHVVPLHSESQGAFRLSDRHGRTVWRATMEAAGAAAHCRPSRPD